MSDSSVHLTVSDKVRDPITACIYDNTDLHIRGACVRRVFISIENNVRRPVGPSAAHLVDGQMR